MKHIRAFVLAFIICIIPCIVFGATKCPSCGKTLTFYNTKYVQKDANTHYETSACPYCDAILNYTGESEHNWYGSSSHEPFNDKQHYVVKSCSKCGITKKIPENHYWSNESCLPYNNTHHYRVQKCYDCNATRKVLENHDLYGGSITKYATPVSPGIDTYKCLDCDATVTRSIPWQLGGFFSTSYDIDHSMIYRNSKSVTVYLNNSFKGAVLKVKIGKKTYKKKITTDTKKVKIKIKKPKKYGQKVVITLNYNGQVIGRDDCSYWDVVWYAKAVKIGMTKKQCKYTWGIPDSISKSSHGYEHWHWNNGDYLRFRKGKLNDWYTTG